MNTNFNAETLDYLVFYERSDRSPGLAAIVGPYTAAAAARAADYLRELDNVSAVSVAYMPELA